MRAKFKHYTRFTVFLLLCFWTQSALAADNDTEAPSDSDLSCPLCGSWKISRANHASYTGQNVQMTEDGLSIPGCGNFDYLEKTVAATLHPNDKRSNIFKYSAVLLFLNGSAGRLCPIEGSKRLMADIEVFGHFKEGGITNIRLTYLDTKEVIFDGQAWNLERELPGDAGSAFGTIAAMTISNAETYRMLASEAASAYEIQGRATKKGLAFNPAKFGAESMAFCSIKHAHTSGGSWPYAWTLICQGQNLSVKLDEFFHWRACMEKSPQKQVFCKPPNEKFGKRPKQYD